MRLIIQPDYQSVSLWAAHYVAAKIKLPTQLRKNLLYWAVLRDLHLWVCIKL